MAAGARGRTLLETHCNAAVESSRLNRQVEAVLRRAGIDTWLLDGTQALSLLWERLHPAAELAEDEEERLLEQLGAACEVAEATSLEEASEVRHRILGAICGSPSAAIDIGEHPGWLRHGDGTLEETIHLATPPLSTDASWLAHLLSCPLPATLAVHIGVGVRSREKRRSAAAGSACVQRSAIRSAATGSSAPTRRTRSRRRRDGRRAGRTGWRDRL